MTRLWGFWYTTRRKPCGRTRGAKKTAQGVTSPARNTKGNEAMSKRSGCKEKDEYGVRYARFVNRTVGGWQMAAEALFVVAAFSVMILAAVCFD